MNKNSSNLVCLLPARNCEGDLPGYFESVSRFADAVVALNMAAPIAQKKSYKTPRS